MKPPCASRFSAPLFSALLLLLAFAAGPAAHALEFRVLSWQGEVGGLRYESAGKVVALVAGEGALSPKHRFADGKPLVLFREVTDAEGSVRRETVATLPAPPADVAKAILVLAPAGPEKTIYSGRWFADDPVTNQFQFRNLSRHAVALKIGGEDLVLAPNEDRTLAFDTTARSVPIKMAAQTPAGWQLIATTRQPVRANYRILILIREGRAVQDDYAVREARPVELVAFYDYLPPPAS